MTGVSGLASGTDAGTYFDTLSGATGSGLDNYDITYQNGSLAIGQALLTLTYSADSVRRAYGSNNPALTGDWSVAGLVGSDLAADVIGGTARFASSADSRSNVGTYAIEGDGLTSLSANYRIEAVQAAGNAAALTIDPATVSLLYIANYGEMTYGSTVPGVSGTIRVSGLRNGDAEADVIGGTVTFATTATSTSNVGRFGIEGSGLVSINPNYVLSTRQAWRNATAMAVRRADLTVTYTADAARRTYGSAGPALGGTWSASGLVNGDQLADVVGGGAVFRTRARLRSGVGTYEIYGGGLVSLSANYRIRTVQAAGNADALTIDPARLLVTYTASPASMVQGSAVPTLGGSFRVAGLRSFDAPGSVIGGTATFATTATSQSAIGHYAINGSGLFSLDSNYVIDAVQSDSNAAALTIGP